MADILPCSTRWCCLLLLWLSPTLGFPASAPPTTAADWTAEDSMLLYFEAITQIQKHGLQPATTQEVVRHTLRHYLQSIDPFSEYLSPEEYRQFREAQQPYYAGIGIELRRDAAGSIVCVPYPQGPAIRAGITAGDILQAVDGRPVENQSLLAVSAQIRGEQGTPVRLRIATPSGTPRDIVIERAEIHAQSVHLVRRGPLPIVRLYRFAPQTAHELRQVVQELPEAQAVIFDVRGNPGGALYSAIDAAKLFLTPGQHIVTIETRDGREEHRQGLTATYETMRLYVWQDTHTASAAEVFIAALTENARAVSIGYTSFGKGVIQDIIPLQDGSALSLTTGRLQTPSGAFYHGTGLVPTYPLEPSEAGTDAYLAKVHALLQRARLTTLEMEITLTDPPTSPPAPSTGPSYILCFDKDFSTKKEAASWESEVKLSINNMKNFIHLTRNEKNKMYYIVCLGIYESQEEANKKIKDISQSMQEKVFLKVVE